MPRKIGLFGLIAALTLAGCSMQATQKAEATTVPTMRWDHHPEAAKWTTNTLMAVAQEDAVLASRVPSDIAQWCPGYESGSLHERRAFWAGLISAVGKYESSYNPKAAGAGGRYIGIMQISPRSAANYGCDAKSSGALKDGSANLACAVEMVAYHVKRDGMAVGGGNRGIGRDWMPFRKADKRAEMRNWLSSQSYCQ
ncbi:MAG TPA: transglycosylase SLT domain-containing protein [Gemmobacter sp.]|nr:transglycosylase SLT domain-containing protein [Gemmobacter sp.]